MSIILYIFAGMIAGAILIYIYKGKMDIAQLTQFLGAVAAVGAMLVSWETSLKVHEVSGTVETVKTDIHKVEVATNSMKDALVNATAKSSRAEGVIEGRADASRESDSAEKAAQAEKEKEAAKSRLKSK